MKLIDVLVQELPRRGGWPAGVEEIWQDYDRMMRPIGWFHDELCDDHRRQHHDAHVKISRKQYEAALASSKSKWDGEGLPPIGAKCEFISNDTTWGEVSVIGFDGDKVVFKPSGDTYYAIAPSNKQIFRPIRSEADKKRDEAIHAITELCRNSASNGHSAELIYDAIKSGKIVID